MKRALFWFSLLLAVAGATGIGYEVVQHSPPHPTTLYLFGGMVLVGAVFAALMADPKTVLAFLERVASLRFGKGQTGLPPDSGAGSGGGL